MDPLIIVAVIGFLSTPIGIWLTWLRFKKKDVADIYDSISGASKNAVETMQMTMDALHNELKSADGKIDKLIAANRQLQDRFDQLSDQYRQLITENAEQRKMIDDLTKTMGSMTSGSVILIGTNDQMV